MLVGFDSIPLQQRPLEFGELEEVVLLGHPLHPARLDVLFGHVFFGHIGLVRHRVPAVVDRRVDVAVVVGPLHERLHGLVMTGLGGADELVVGHPELGPRFPEALAGAVGLVQGGQAVGLGGPLHLEAVLVGAGQIEDVFAQEPVPAGDGVTVEHGVGVADVGRVVDVEDRGRQEITRHRSTLLSSAF